MNEELALIFLRRKVAQVTRPPKEKRTYTIEGLPAHLDQIEKAMFAMDHLGRVGSSRTIKIGYDGDGRARLRFAREGGELKKPENLKNLTEESEIRFSVD